MERLKAFTNIIIASGVILYLLVIGKNVILPFIMALIIWYLVISIAGLLEHYKMPYPVALTFSILICVFIVYSIILIVNSNINELIREIPKYQGKLQSILIQFSNRFDINLAAQIKEFMSSINLTGIFSDTALVLTNIVGKIGVISIYVLFLLLEYRNFDHKLQRMITSKIKYNKIRAVIQQIAVDVNLYLKIKTIISLAVGITSYIILKIVGVDFAEFWGLLFILLNYIPIIGSFIAVMFPVLVTAVQFQSLSVFIVVLSLLYGAQFITGSILEPRMMGKSLNLSPLVIFFSLAFWGSVWGIMGAFICVPITAIMNIILSKFKSTRPISIALSAKGEIE